VGKFGVDICSTVSAAVQARKFVPQLGHYPVDAEPAAALPRRVQHLNHYFLPWRAALVTELTGGYGSSGDAGVGCGANHN